MLSREHGLVIHDVHVQFRFIWPFCTSVGSQRYNPSCILQAITYKPAFYFLNNVVIVIVWTVHEK